MSPRLSEESLRAPVNVTWEITETCNLSCSHCLSADLRAPGSRELDTAACHRVLSELARMQVFQINIGGGEPFLRDDILDLLAHAHALGITTCVSTNGTALNESLVEELLRMDAPVYLQVSLDGASPGTNDALRGAGTFERILSGIELLAQYAYPDFSLNMVVTRVNAGELAEFHALARTFGARTRLSRFRPSGAGCGRWEEYRLSREQLLELSAFLGEHPDIATGDSFFALEPESRRALGLHMCGAARMTCAIAPDGSVYPCAFLCDPEFLAGNVTDTPLAAIFETSPVLAAFRKLEVESCRGCDRFGVCHGGCPAIGYFLTRSVGSPDPECLRSLLPVQRPTKAELPTERRRSTTLEVA